jgi:hypothetical protein
MEPIVARKTWRTLEPVHGMIYFVAEAAEEYGAVGLKGMRMGYFASRAAAMGPVPADTVVATFFNFRPSLVRRAIPAAWDLAPPAVVLEARFRAADRALRRAFAGQASEVVQEAADLAKRAASAACEHLEGRPLFAAHSELPWPAGANLTLWHAQTLLREFRGDGHVALLTAAGLSGAEALVVHAATGDVPAALLQASRAWPDDAWNEAIEAIGRRGWLAPGPELALSELGREHRQRVEDETDRLSLAAYEPLGEDGCQRLRELGRPLSQAVVEAGMLVPDPGRWLGEDEPAD